jgi:anti-sigma factor RsiW
MKNIIVFLKKLVGMGMFQCNDVEKLLFDYAQGNLDPQTTGKLDRHLQDCPGCLEFVRTYRMTIAATRTHCAPAADMPPELEKKLKDFISQNL